MKFIKNLQFLIYSCFIICLSAEMNAQEVWEKIDDTTFELNTSALSHILKNVTKEQNTTAVINFPNEKGEITAFRISDNSILPQNLAIKYPGIHAYKGVSIENSNLSITLTCTPKSIAGTLIKGTHVWSLEKLDDTNIYILVDDNQVIGERINCSNEESETLPAVNASAKHITGSISSSKTLIGDNTLKIFRTAVIVNGEYSTYFINKLQLNSASDASKVAAVLGAIVTSLNNLNAVFERDLGIRFELIENNDELIFLNANTDPFNTSNSNTLTIIANDEINNTIGINNYDIGHLFGSGGSDGLAAVSGLCSSRKAEALSISPVPEGTSFDFTLLAHEFGHQLGANHTQNYACARNTFTSVEPGSGSTIMGYAGISCANSSDEVQSLSDEYFHLVSINQIKNHIQSVSCGIENIEINNNLPVIEQLPNYTIPANANFILEANTTDADNDSLTYCWEQLDPEIADQTPPVSTSVGGPLFRSFSPTTSASRKFPRFYDTNTTWEVIPSVSRELNFGLTVRDGNPSGITTSSLTVTVVNTGGKFAITSPNAGSFPQNSIRQIEWNVAGTNSNGINTENVNIELSYDNGATFPVMLAENTPNDGVERVTIPVGQTTDIGKIRITPVNNIYYALSPNNFNITPEEDDDLAPIVNLVEKQIDIQIYKLQVPQYEFALYDMLGRVLLSQTLTSDDPDPIDVSYLSRGMYIIKLVVGSQIYNRKIVKL